MRTLDLDKKWIKWTIMTSTRPVDVFVRDGKGMEGETRL